MTIIAAYALLAPLIWGYIMGTLIGEYISNKLYGKMDNTLFEWR